MTAPGLLFTQETPMVTKHLPSQSRHAFRWRLLLAVVGLIALDHFLAPAHAARLDVASTAVVTSLLR